MKTRKCCWRVTVLSHDGQTLLQHATAEDWKETQCIATEARSRDLSTQIWIRDPMGKLQTWDSGPAS